MPITPFCTDADLLAWEPNIFRDAPFASQTLLAGTGTLSGTSFTIESGSFADAGIAADHVITLGGDIDGCFPIRAVDSDTANTVSALDQLNEPSELTPPLSASGPIPFAIRTFRPQREIVTQLIAQAGSLESTDELLNADVLARPCALGTFELIYSALAAISDNELASRRAAFYERLYRRALRHITIEVDTNGDGQLDERRTLSVLRFQRA